MRRSKVRLFIAFIAIGALCACGLLDGLKKEEKNDESIEDVVITGALALTGTLADASSAQLNLTADVGLADLSIYCVTFKMPPQAGTGSISDSGEFSVTIVDGSGSSIGCFFLIAATEKVVGTMVFEDKSKTSMSGGTKASDKMVFSGATSLGAFTLNLSTGKAVVDVAQITTGGVNIATGTWDFTGTYKISAAGVTLPTGYSELCTMEEEEDHTDGGKDCMGPADGMNLWLQRIAGKATSDGSDKFGMSIWESEDSFKACGSKLPVTYAEAKEHAGIDLTASGIAEGPYTWNPAALVDGWKHPDATAMWMIAKEEQVADFKGYAGTKQYFSQYHASLDNSVKEIPGFSFYANSDEVGCKDADGKPVQMQDWSGLEYDQDASEDLKGVSEGLRKEVSTGTVDGAAVTCIHINGTFKTDGTPITDGWAQHPTDYITYANGGSCADPNSPPNFDDDGNLTCTVGDVIAGTKCSDVPLVTDTTDAGTLAQLKCYLNYFQKKFGDQSDSSGDSCVPDLQANWNAETLDDFLADGDGPMDANSNFVFELFEFDGPESGALRGEDNYYESVKVGDFWTNCQVEESFSFAMSKIAGSDNALVEMVSVTKNLSDKPACQAKYGEGKITKNLFNMIKQ